MPHQLEPVEKKMHWSLRMNSSTIRRDSLEHRQQVLLEDIQYQLKDQTFDSKLGNKAVPQLPQKLFASQQR